MTDRKGPVVVEFPVDITYQSCDNLVQSTIDDSCLVSSPDIIDTTSNFFVKLKSDLQSSKNPFIVLGNGIRSLPANQLSQLLRILSKKNISFSSTWGSKDLLEPYLLEGYCGSPGIFGNRKRHVDICRGIDIHMANALVMLDHRHFGML